MWLAAQRPGIDVFHICKLLYFADKNHLNQYGRPVLGDTYYALPEGPVPSLAYDIAERDAVHVSGRVLEIASQSLSFFKGERDEFLRLCAKREPNLRLFSRTDLACLTDAVTKYADLPTKELWEIVHKEPAYLAVYREGEKPSVMSYESLLDSRDPYFTETLADLREHAREIIF